MTDEQQTNERDTGIGIAARLWCDPRTERTVMDPTLCKVAAEQFDILLARIAELEGK